MKQSAEHNQECSLSNKSCFILFTQLRFISKGQFNQQMKRSPQYLPKFTSSRLFSVYSCVCVLSPSSCTSSGYLSLWYSPARNSPKSLLLPVGKHAVPLDGRPQDPFIRDKSPLVGGTANWRPLVRPG
jgi:hypothetical protein